MWRFVQGSALVLWASVGALAQTSPPPCVQSFSPSQPDSDGWFGSAVDLSGDRIVVGAFRPGFASPQPGAAYVFAESQGVWAEEARLDPGDPADGNRFGQAVAIDGDTVAVGAPWREHPALGTETGVVYVFQRAGSSWSQTARLFADDLGGGDHFGTSVLLDSGRLFVGAPRASFTGVVYVYEQVGAAWVLRRRLVGDGGRPERFGTALALDGQRLVVGAPYASGPAHNVFSGAAYVFEWNGAHWDRTRKLFAQVTWGGEQFGSAVDIQGDFVVVGAPYSDLWTIWSGAAYPFRLTGAAGWVQEGTLQPSITEYFDGLGVSIAIDGDRAYAGASPPVYNPSDRGRVHVFQRSVLGAPWLEVDVLTGSGLPYDDQNRGVGYAMLVRGSRLVAGAPVAGAALFDGRCYVLDLPVEQTLYCSGKTSSVGCVPFLSTCGNPRITGGHPFEVTAEDVLPGEPCLLVYGFQPAQAPFHGGTLCVSTPFERWTPADLASADGANAACPGRSRRDFANRIQSGVDPQLTVGQAVFAQVWQRDPGDPTGFGDSLTNALRFVVQP